MIDASEPVLDVLVLGCGSRQGLPLSPPGSRLSERRQFRVDIDPATKPDLLADLNDGLPPDWIDKFDEIHAYEVLEHIGKQGDWLGFFEEFEGYWRVLKPGGYLLGSVPRHDSIWAWSDPGHTRIISAGTFAFLSQKIYARDVGKSPMTDYRRVYRGDFETVFVHHDEHSIYFCLRAVKETA